MELRRYRILIERSKHRLTLFRDGKPQTIAKVVIGAPATPTPAGRFAVLEVVRQPSGSVLGPWALHLTAHSNVLDNYGGGPGRVALHGRSGALLGDPLGSSRSHGCIRMSNAVIKKLRQVAEEGTPVEIRLACAAESLQSPLELSSERLRELEREGIAEGARCVGIPAHAPQELRPGRMPQRVVARVVSCSTSASARSGPSRSPIATARLSATTGVGWMPISTSYQEQIACQSVLLQLGASAWQAAIAACTT